jgi:hypothetical protein
MKNTISLVFTVFILMLLLVSMQIFDYCSKETCVVSLQERVFMLLSVLTLADIKVKRPTFFSFHYFQASNKGK